MQYANPSKLIKQPLRKIESQQFIIKTLELKNQDLNIAQNIE